MNTEKIEGGILSEIRSCSNHSPILAKKYLSPIVQLFESTFDRDKYLPKNNLEDFRNNKLAYFNSVKTTLNEYVENLGYGNMKVLNESMQIFHTASNDFQLSVQDFLGDLTNVIDEIKFQNDFDKFDTYSREVQKTLLFRKQPINIAGFNVFEFLNPNNIVAKELQERFGALISRDLKMLLFNKSDKEIYFIFDRNKQDKTIIFYNINTNILDFFLTKDLYEEFGISNEEFNNMIWKDEKKIFESFSKFINGNIIELYRNFNKFDIKFEDNIYKDQAWNNYNMNMKRNSIVK